jgi:hypothetical protein
MRNTMSSVLWAICLASWPLLADERREQIQIETLLTELDNPCGIALESSSGDLYIAESGAGRILRVRPSEPDKQAIVIEGFPREDFGDGPKYRIGPLAVALIDRSTLVVGEGGQGTGDDVVRVYSLAAEDKTLAFDQSKQVLGPIAAGGESASGAGDFYAIATTAPNLFVAGNGDDSRDWILKADLAGATASQLKAFLATKAETNTGAPTALAISKRGELIVGQAGRLDRGKDSMLSFYHAKTSKKLLSLKTELYDITGLAYAPQSGLLYAVDFAWAAPSAGGLYRLDMDVRNGRQIVKSVKLPIALNRPAGLAVASDSVVYVTTFGNQESSRANSAKTGQLLKVTGNLSR